MSETQDQGRERRRRMRGTQGPRVSLLNPTEMRLVAVAAGVDPRTVAKYLRGDPIVSTVEDRIQAALKLYDEGKRCSACGQLVLKK